MFRFDGRVAIITGAASGIGRATAQTMALAGAAVVISDIDEKGAQEVAGEILDGGSEAIAVRADISDPGDLENLVESTAANFGRIDVLVNNAADLKAARLGDGDVVDTDLQVWDRTYGANLRGTAAACKYAIPQMLRTGAGSIVNVASISALGGDVTRVAYGATKAAIIHLTKSIATSHGKKGIRCNAVCPGPVLSRKLPDDYVEVQLENLLTREYGQPQDLANVIAFLASDLASYITGEIINVDGGMMAHMPWHALFESGPDTGLR